MHATLSPALVVIMIVIARTPASAQFSTTAPGMAQETLARGYWTDPSTGLMRAARNKRASRASAQDSCQQRGGGVSAAGGLLLTAMDVGLSDAAVHSADAQFRAQHAFGVTARFELPVSSTLGIRVEAATSSIGIVHIPWSGPNEGVPSSAGIGRVDMRQLLSGAFKHRQSGQRFCPYVGGVVGYHDFSYRELRSSGLTIGGLGGFDVAFAQHDSVFVEFGLNTAWNGLNILGTSENPPFFAVTVPSGSIAVGVKHRF